MTMAHIGVNGKCCIQSTKGLMQHFECFIWVFTHDEEEDHRDDQWHNRRAPYHRSRHG